MTRRITCYVVFVTLIWGANTQNEENIQDNKFNSNMTRNDFSKLLSSLIKLNEQRVSVLQKLYKLEDYGVLSEVLRNGDSKPEEAQGNPNNLFLIVMSKNKTDPSRRNFNVEIVDSVPMLDVGSKKVQRKLNYVLDPASYISQNTPIENSIETMFGNIPKVYGPNKTLLIDDRSKENATAKEKLKDPEQKTEMSSNILRTKKTDLKAKKEKKNRNKKSKSHHHPELFVTDTMEDAISINNHKYKDREDEHDFVDTLLNNNQNHKKSEEKEDENKYVSPYSKEIVENVSNYKTTEIGSDTSIQKVHSNNTPKPKKKSHSPMIKTQGDQHPKFNRNRTILNNSYNKYTVILEEIKTTTEKATDETNNNQNHKKSEEKEDGNNYVSPYSKEIVENVSNHKTTEIDSDTSIQKVHSNNTPKPKKKSHSPMTKAQGDQHPKFNRNRTILNNSYNKYTLILEEIKTTTEKATDETNNNQNGKLPLQNKDLEDENYDGYPFSKEYDENGPNLQRTKIDDYTPKVIIQYKKPLNFNRSKSTSIIEQDTTYSTITTDLTTITARNVITVSTVNIDKTSKKNQDLKYSIKIEKIPALSSKIASGSGIPETTKDLPFNNYDDNNYPKDDGDNTNKENPGSPDEIEYEDEEAENNANHGTENPSLPIMVSENVDVKTTLPVKTDLPSYLQEVTENSIKENPEIAKDKTTENSNKDKPKTTKGLRIRHNNNAKADNGDFIIQQKKDNTFSIIVTHTGKEKPEEIKQHDNLRGHLKASDQPEDKPVGRTSFQKCLNKKAKKLCRRSCISAYKNVCTRLKCTSKAKKALKKECKKSCEKTFKSSSSKYSDEDSGEDSGDYSDEDSDDDSDTSGSDSSDSYSS